MRRFFLIASLLFISLYCFAQQNLPARIIGTIPDRNSTKTFQVQVGAFKLEKNAENAVLVLQKNALNPTREKYQDFTRVVIKGIPAGQVANFLAIIAQAGFNETIIREDSPAAVSMPSIPAPAITRQTISEKWEINNSDSAYSSFEFNHNRNYIAVENNEDNSVHFGEYSIPQRDTINMENLGTVRINNNNDTSINFTFSSKEEPGKEMRFTAAKAETIVDSPELDLLCRTWRVVDCTDKDNVGFLLLISNAGTYFFTTPDGTLNNLSQWRWYNERKEEFEYTHDNWEHYGRAKILDLSIKYLEVHDPGFSYYIRGYSEGFLDNYWELVPADN